MDFIQEIISVDESKGTITFGLIPDTLLPKLMSGKIRVSVENRT